MNNGRNAASKPTRYSVRFQEGSRIEEVFIGTKLETAIRRAKRHHSDHGFKTWVWNVRTGETLFQMDAPSQSAAGGGR